MPDDLNIPIKTPGAGKAKRDLKDIAAAEKRVGDEASRSGKQARKGFRGTSKAVGGLVGKLKNLVGAYLGLQGARMALAALRAETERVDEATRKAAESMRALMALSSLKGERKEVREKVWDMAIKSGSPIEQVAPAYYTLMGGTAGMDQSRRQALASEALLMGKTDPSANLDAMMGLFSTIGTQQPGLSPKQIGNIVSRTIEQAKSTPEEMSAYLPTVLTTAKTGKVDIATAMAMFSFSTRYGGGVAKSGTAVSAAMLGLLSPSPDVAKQLGQHGYAKDMSLEQKIGWLGAQGGQLSPEVMAALGGRRGIEAISAISSRPKVFRREVSLMQGALNAQGSLLKERLRDMYGEVASQRYLDQLNQMEVIRQKLDVKPEETLEDTLLEFRDTTLKKQGAGPLTRTLSKAMENTYRYVTGSLIPTGQKADTAMEDLIKEGYSPADIMDVVLPYHEKQKAKHGFGHYDIPEGKTHKEVFEEQLRKSGREKMQGKEVSVINQSGTFYNVHNRRDPAGRPVNRLT